MLLPRHVVDILLAMERICSGRRAPDAAPAPKPTPRTSGLRFAGVRVQSSQPAAAINLESQGPERQTIM